MQLNLKHVAVLYFAFLVILAPFIFPDGDSFYYWEWGNHLSLSYLDGPPMIAYLMRFFCLIFGNTFFAMNIVGIFCAAGISYFLFQIGRLLRDRETGMLAVALWLFFPLVAQALFVRVTYDAPESLFWIMTLYGAVRYLGTRQVRFLYWMGTTAGLLLLSKYTGLIVIAGILIYFASQRSLRAVFKNPHFYGAMCVAIVIASPVLIWNAQHQWVSFGFQFGQHVTAKPMPFAMHLWNILGFLWRLLYCLNLLLILPFWFWMVRKNSVSGPQIRYLLITVSATFIGVWLLASYSAHAKVNYFLPLVLTLALLLADDLQGGKARHLTRALLGIFACISIIMILSCAIWFAPLISYEYPVYLLQKQLIIEAQRHGQTEIITTGWNSVPRLAFIAKQLNLPEVILPRHPCDLNIDGTYRYFSGTPLQSGQIKQALYLNVRFPYPNCITPYFKSCTPLQGIVYFRRQILTHQPVTVTTYWMSCKG